MNQYTSLPGVGKPGVRGGFDKWGNLDPNLQPYQAPVYQQQQPKFQGNCQHQNPVIQVVRKEGPNQGKNFKKCNDCNKFLGWARPGQLQQYSSPEYIYASAQQQEQEQEKEITTSSDYNLALLQEDVKYIMEKLNMVVSMIKGNIKSSSDNSSSQRKNSRKEAKETSLRKGKQPTPVGNGPAKRARIESAPLPEAPDSDGSDTEGLPSDEGRSDEGHSSK